MHSRQLRAHLAVLAGALAIALPAWAHHGWADYQETESQVTGVVQSVELGAPHGLIKVKAANGVWDVMLAARSDPAGRPGTLRPAGRYAGHGPRTSPQRSQSTGDQD